MKYKVYWVLFDSSSNHFSVWECSFLLHLLSTGFAEVLRQLLLDKLTSYASTKFPRLNFLKFVAVFPKFLLIPLKPP